MLLQQDAEHSGAAHNQQRQQQLVIYITATAVCVPQRGLSGSTYEHEVVPNRWFAPTYLAAMKLCMFSMHVSVSAPAYALAVLEAKHAQASDLPHIRGSGTQITNAQITSTWMVYCTINHAPWELDTSTIRMQAHKRMQLD